MHDVAVIGAGPVGSQVAARLAAMGHDVLVIERNRSLTEPVCCTGIISRECVDSYAVGDNVVLRWAKSARIFSPSGRAIRLWRPEPQAAIVDRPALNVALAARAQGRGASYLLGTRVSRIEASQEMVRIQASRGEAPLTIQARAAVVAAGFSPRLVESLGLGGIGDWALGIQIEVTAEDAEEIEVYYGRDVAPGFFAWLVPTSPGAALVGLLARRRAEDYFQQLLGRVTTEDRVSPLEPGPARRVIPLRPLARTFGERLLVVGAAAGQVKPTTGGGVYFGLLCADIAAEHLHQALQADRLSAQDLAGYERAWKKRLGGELRMGRWARRVYEHLGDGQIDRIFGILESSGILEALAQAEDLSFDWHGRAVSRAIGYEVVLKALVAAGLPASLRRRFLDRPRAGNSRFEKESASR